LSDLKINLRAGDIWRSRLSSRELEFHTRQLATLLAAGLPLDQTLVMLADQASRPATAQMYDDIRSVVREGGSLAVALARYPREFPAAYLAVVTAGEFSGSLPEVLTRLAEALQAQNSLKTGLMTALAYPVVVSMIAFMIVLGLMAYVVPQVVSVLSTQQQSLPLLTKILIVVSGFIADWGWLLFLLFGSATFSAIHAYRTRTTFRERVDHRLLTLPILGRLILLAETAQLAGMVAIMLSGGVTLLTALHHGAQTLRNRWLKSKVIHVISLVREGASFGRSLDNAQVFPRLLVQMVLTGERSGQLAQMLSAVTKEFEFQLRYRTSLLTTVLEPLLILAMGGLVLLIVLAVMMPLIEMNALLR
jgi:general secretion pathway protein F